MMREGMATGEYKELASYLRAVATIMMDDKTSDANINDTVPLRQDHEDARPRDTDEYVSECFKIPNPDMIRTCLQ